MCNSDKWVSIVEIAQNDGDTACLFLERLLQKKDVDVDVNAVDQHGWAMIHRMTETNRVDKLKLLLESGASVDLKPRNVGLTPLLMCVCNIFSDENCFPHGGKVDIAKLLIEHGANVDINADFDHVGSFTVLTGAISFDCPEIFDMLLAAGADIENNSPLVGAAFYGRLDMAHALLSAGALVNATNTEGRTALMAACDGLAGEDEAGNKTMLVRVLLGAGASFDMCEDDGSDALAIAFKFGRRDAISLLKEAGAVLNRDACDAARSLVNLCGRGDGVDINDLIIELMDLGVDLNATLDCGVCTPHFWAVRWGRTWLANELIHRGALHS